METIITIIGIIFIAIVLTIFVLNQHQKKFKKDVKAGIVRQCSFFIGEERCHGKVMNYFPETDKVSITYFDGEGTKVCTRFLNQIYF